MGDITLLFIIAVIWYFSSKRKGKSQQTSSAENITFSDGPESNLIMEFTDAFVVLSNHHYEACHYTLTPDGARMRFQDYAEDSAMVALIANNDNTAYLRWLDFLGDKRDCGWILRQYGRHTDSGYWVCEVNSVVSKSTAEKVLDMLSKSSRLQVSKSDSAIVAHKFND